MTQENEISR